MGNTSTSDLGGGGLVKLIVFVVAAIVLFGVAHHNGLLIGASNATLEEVKAKAVAMIDREYATHPIVSGSTMKVNVLVDEFAFTNAPISDSEPRPDVLEFRGTLLDQKTSMKLGDFTGQFQKGRITIKLVDIASERGIEDQLDD